VFPSLRVVLGLLAIAAVARAEGFSPPVLKEEVRADYPPEAAAQRLSATVVLEISVAADGSVSDVTVKEKAGHGFDEAAVAAAKKISFIPANENGTPVPSLVTYRYRFTIAASPKIAPAPTGILRGQILARGTRAPIPGAHLIATPDGSAPIERESDAEGRFEFPSLPAGPLTITVAGDRVDRAVFHEQLKARDALTVHYFVDLLWSARYQTTVRGSPERVEVSRTLTTEELTHIPGTFGDALRAIENLPGVARAPFNSGLIIVRGGKPTDSRSFFAGSEIPQLYHFGGFTSVVPSHLVDSIDFYPGNFSARYGRATAGIIDVDLRPGQRDRLHGWGDTNVFDTGVGVEGPVGKGSFILSGRRSYVDAVLKGASAIGGLDGAPLRFTTAPVYYDYQAILDYPLGGGQLRLVIFGSDDDLRFLFDQPQEGDPSLRGAFETHIFFHRLQARWKKSSGPWTFLIQSSTGYNGSSGSLGSALNFNVGVLGSDERIEVGYTVSPRFKLLAGVDTQAALVNLAADLPLAPPEGTLPLPLSAATKYHADETLKVFNAGLYLEAVIRATPSLTFTPGLRFDYWSPVLHPAFNPRLAARWQVGPLTTIRAGAGLYSQDPQPQDYDPIFGNPRLRPETALHVSLSVEQAIYRGLMLELTGFYKQLWDLVVTSTANVLGADGMVTQEKKSNDGDGRIYGGELLLRQALNKFMFGWLSYTLMKSERRDCGTCAWRLFDYDQTHVLTLALSFRLPRGFGAGLRFRYVSGFPYTLARGGEFDSDAGVYIPGQVPTNNARLDAFQELDLRIDKTFVFERWQLKAYLDVTNVYNHANAEIAQYSFDYTRQVAVTGLPIIPSFGIRGEF
jgi:TonB family protein